MPKQNPSNTRDYRSEAQAVAVAFGPAMRARIASGTIDATEARWKNAELALRLDGKGTQKPSLDSQERKRWAKLAREGWIDIESVATVNNLGSVPLYDRLINARHTEGILAALMHEHTNPNQPIYDGITGGGRLVHPLIATVRAPGKFSLLLDNPNIDYSAAMLGQQPLGDYLQSELRLVAERRSKLSADAVRETRERIEHQFNVVVKSIEAARDHGVQLGLFANDPLGDASLHSWEIWMPIERGKQSIAEVPKGEIKRICSIVGVNEVFRPALWRGHEVQALAAINDLHPSLQQQIARETGALRATATPANGDWRHRVTYSPRVGVRFP